MKNILGQVVIATILIAIPQLAHGKEYTVKMISTGEKGSYYFEPKKLKIKSGDTVTWVNMQDEEHNVMMEKIPASAKEVDSPLLEKKGDKWSHTFTVSGTYSYHCHPHASLMKGMIIVDTPSKSAQMKEAEGHKHSHHN